MNVVFRASRWNRNIRQSSSESAVGIGVISRQSSSQKTCGIDDGEGDYLNCPMTRRRVSRVLRGAHDGGIGDGARFRQGEVLRRMPADRSDGASRRGHAAVRADEAGRAEGSANRPAAVRRRAAAAGQPRRRSLQPRRISDAVEVGRAGESAAHDSGPRAGRVRAVRHGPSQHLHQRADRAARDVADARQPVTVFRGADFRRRGLRRVGGIGTDCRPQCRSARRAAKTLRVPPRTTAIGALAFYVSHANPHDYQPTNITFGIMEPPPGHIRDKQKRKLAISERALADLEESGTRRRDAESSRKESQRSATLRGSSPDA